MHLFIAKLLADWYWILFLVHYFILFLNFVTRVLTYLNLQVAFDYWYLVIYTRYQLKLAHTSEPFLDGERAWSVPFNLEEGMPSHRYADAYIRGRKTLEEQRRGNSTFSQDLVVNARCRRKKLWTSVRLYRAEPFPYLLCTWGNTKFIGY